MGFPSVNPAPFAVARIPCPVWTKWFVGAHPPFVFTPTISVGILDKSAFFSLWTSVSVAAKAIFGSSAMN